MNNLQYIMEIYISNQQILFIIIIRKLTLMGCHIRKQQMPIILDPDLKDKEYVYQIKTKGARKMQIYQWGEINLQSIEEEVLLNKIFPSAERFYAQVMNLQLCYFILNQIYSFMNLDDFLQELVLEKSLNSKLK
ncbi:unnamed protein product [Paramecium pentaurelia]|uniref:Uncharacterized protein n=1 Tax=Paramecium pentaurelia TaxID=43138 RepID=A0A8S1SN09_9CILI|nr:unnamed protein product [Paramecium pentaurelia]